MSRIGAGLDRIVKYLVHVPQLGTGKVRGGDSWAARSVHPRAPEPITVWLSIAAQRTARLLLTPHDNRAALTTTRCKERTSGGHPSRTLQYH